jgi:hypothetical protein
MRPIAHARRLTSRASSSPTIADAVVLGSPVPIGIPAVFLADQLSRGRTAEQILSGKRGLIAEYAGAEGYAYRWGHLIEARLGRFVLWRVVPVAMWEQLAERRAGSPLLIEELLTRVQASISPALVPASAGCPLDRMPRHEPPQPACPLRVVAGRAARR